MDTDAPAFIILSAVCAAAVLSSFVALAWAAVLDGRDERAFRLTHRVDR